MAPTIATLAARIADGSTTATALVEDSLARIAADDRHGAALHAVLRVNPEALTEAAALDRTPSTARGPLHGIPLVIKDNIDLLGSPTTSGCRGLAAAMPRTDAAVVRRLRAAGAIIVAKTNMAELSFEIRSRSSLGGDVRNPFDTSVTAGGSSGGTAAAVAAGFACAGLGTDTGGSIRIPAAYCGLVGFRPAWGAVGMAGIAPLAPSADTVGPLARSVADAALIFAVMTRPRPGAVVPRGRIGVLRLYFGQCADIGAAAEAALSRLAGGGMTIVDALALPPEVLPDSDVDLVDHEFAEAFNTYLAGNFSSGAPASLAALHASGAYLSDYEAVLQRRLISPADRQPYSRLLERRAALRAAVIALFDGHDLDALLYPTSAVLPTSLANPAGGLGPELAAWTGLPAVTLPVGYSSMGMPIGLEFLGRGDWQLLDLAAAVESILQVPTDQESGRPRR